jgi:hypothetical protein
MAQRHCRSDRPPPLRLAGSLFAMPVVAGGDRAPHAGASRRRAMRKRLYAAAIMYAAT